MIAPLITIITINFNDKIGLERTIKSVVNQTWKDVEYIVIDGGSTDGSKAVIEQYQNKIDYWISESDSGIYNAMNKGIKKSNGTYLLFLNSGDELSNLNILEENHRAIHTEELVYFDAQLIYPDSTVKEHQFPETIDYTTFLEGTIGHPTTFIKRTLFDKIGLYDETLKIVSDWKFFSQAVIHHQCSRRKINKTLSKFYMDGISSNNVELLQQERKLVLEEHFSDYLRLANLELFVTEVKMSRIVKVMRKLGFMKVFNKI